MTTLLLLALVISIAPSALSQEFDEVPYCDDGRALKEDVIAHTIRPINDDIRYRLLKGKQMNGPATNGPTFLPKAAKMSEVKWSCNLEKQADTLLDKCSDTAPSTPAGQTGLFFKMDGFDDLSYVTAISAWMEEIDKAPLNDAATKGNSKAVTYQGNAATNNYENLIRHDITEIGCGQVHCKENGSDKYRAFCLINKPPLKKGDILYEKA